MTESDSRVCRAELEDRPKAQDQRAPRGVRINRSARLSAKPLVEGGVIHDQE